MALHNFVPAPFDESVGKLKINRNKGSITGGLLVYKYIDKDTMQHVCYAPSLEVSGYGKTKKKALEMLKFSVDQLFDWLMDLPESSMYAELRSLGWRKDRFFNKEFSAAHVDENGVLKGFNAVTGSIERSGLVAA